MLECENCYAMLLEYCANSLQACVSLRRHIAAAYYAYNMAAVTAVGRTASLSSHV